MPDLDATKPTLKGSIAIWSGLIVDIPDNWLLCDGTLSTPDLRSQFVKCVPNTTTNPGTTGGEDNHVLIIAELPTHSHGITDPTHNHSRNGRGLGGTAGEDICTTCIQSSDGVSSETTGLTLTNTGSGTAHENRPAFFEILYIMREI